MQWLSPVSWLVCFQSAPLFSGCHLFFNWSVLGQWSNKKTWHIFSLALWQEAWIQFDCWRHWHFGTLLGGWFLFGVWGKSSWLIIAWPLNQLAPWLRPSSNHRAQHLDLCMKCVHQSSDTSFIMNYITPVLEIFVMCMKTLEPQCTDKGVLPHGERKLFRTLLQHTGLGAAFSLSFTEGRLLCISALAVQCHQCFGLPLPAKPCRPARELFKVVFVLVTVVIIEEYILFIGHCYWCFWFWSTGIQ